MDRMLPNRSARPSDQAGDLNREILRQRAEAMARPLGQDEQADKSIALLEFVLMDARYAVELLKVEAITRIGSIFSIPQVPSHILGIIHRRGASIALVSLRRFFYPGVHGVADADFAVIVNAENKRFALQVEDILGVVHVPKAKLLSTPQNFGGNMAPFVAGVTIDGLALLDLKKIVEAKSFGTSRHRRTVL